MRQARSRKATPEIPVPADARGSPPSLQQAVPGGHVARRMGAAADPAGRDPEARASWYRTQLRAPRRSPPHSALLPLLPPELGSRVGAVVGSSSPPGLP